MTSPLVLFPDVAALFGRPPDHAARQFLLKLSKSGQLVPKQVGPARVAWVRQEVLDFIEHLPRASSGAVVEQAGTRKGRAA